MKSKTLLIILTAVFALPVCSGCGEPPKPVELVSMSHSFVNKDLRTYDVLSDYLKGDGNFKVVMHYSDESTKEYTYEEMSEHSISVSLLDPQGRKKNELNAFGIDGDWTFTTIYNPNSTIKASSTIKVKLPDVFVSSITLSENRIALDKGETTSLSVKRIIPDNATNKEYTWVSSDENIATVNQEGLITAKNYGKVAISAVANDDAHAEGVCALEVFGGTDFPQTLIKETNKDFQRQEAYNLSYCPTVGSPRLLLLPVWFEDSDTFIKTEKREEIRQDIFKTYAGTNEEVGWRSVRTYYKELSNGLLNLNASLGEWYEAPYASQEVGAYETQKILEKAIANYFNIHRNESRVSYDTDGDGFLDGVILIYAAPDYQIYGNNDNLWAYCSWLQEDGDISNPGANVFFWASYDFMYDSLKSKEKTGREYGGNGDNNHCNLDSHSFIHEMGHVLGLEDYYDYSYQYSPAGNFSMQDYNVGSHDAFSAMCYGFVSPFIPTESCEITLNPFQSSKEAILLTPEWNDLDSPFDEYLLLELYTPTGLNQFDVEYKYKRRQQGPTETGIRLWHVDGRVTEYYTRKLVAGCGNRQYILHGLVNTYEGNGVGSERLSPMGKGYYDMNMLQLIRNNVNETYKPYSSLSNDNLFLDGSYFDMDTFSKQFVNGDKLNSGLDLGWSFSVEIIGKGESAQAKITLVRE